MFIKFDLNEAFSASCLLLRLILITRVHSNKPQVGIHYIGIRQQENYDTQIFKDIINRKIDIKKITKKKMAIENYSPDKIAKCILDTCEYGKKI